MIFWRRGNENKICQEISRAYVTACQQNVSAIIPHHLQKVRKYKYARNKPKLSQKCCNESSRSCKLVLGNARLERPRLVLIPHVPFSVPHTYRFVSF